MRDKFVEAMKESMKAGDKARLGAVRLIIAAMKEKDIEARGAGRGQASDEEVLGVLQKMIKQRQESAEVYDKGGRPELAAGERAEIAVISSFLPAQMGEDEVKAAIAAAIAESDDAEADRGVGLGTPHRLGLDDQERGGCRGRRGSGELAPVRG